MRPRAHARLIFGPRRWLGAANVDVAKVRGQLRQQTLYVGAAFVPELQSMGGRRVPQVMQSGLIAGAIVTQHVGVYPQPAERVLRRTTRETIACASDEQWRIRI